MRSKKNVNKRTSHVTTHQIDDRGEITVNDEGEENATETWNLSGQIC
jgi:hypothetical protein